MKIRKLKHIFLASCTATPFVGISAAVNNNNNEAISSQLKEFPLIPLAKELNHQPEDKKAKMYLHNDVAYIGIKEFLDAVSSVIKRENIDYNFDGNKVVLTYKTGKDDKSKFTVSIDYDKKKIVVSNYKIFTSILKKHERGEEKLDIEFLGSENKNSTEEFEYDLNKYDIDILKDKNDLYLPQILLNQILLNESNIQTYFNGAALNLFRFVESLSGSGSFYLKQSTKNNEKSIPKGLKEFQFKYFSFLLDHYYGIKFGENEKFNESYKGFIETYKSEITHDNSDIHYLSTRKIINDLDDSHSAYILDGYYLKHNEVIKHPIKVNKRVTDRLKLGEELGKLYFKNNIEYQNLYTPDGKTAVISFRAFEEKSATYIEKSLKEAKEKGVRNVIFNITHNGGSYIGAAYEIMGFLTDKPFNVWTHNPLTGENKIETIKSKKTKYNFNYFVLTAPFSFSAGNIFPQLVRDNNLGKVIGYNTFGGSSAIDYYILPTGDIIQLSSNTVFTDKDFKTNEFGINPDYPFKENIETGAKNLYDLEYLQKFVNEINKENNIEPNKPINKPNSIPWKPLEPKKPVPLPAPKPHNTPDFNSDNDNIMIIIPDSGFTPNNVEKPQGRGKKAGVIAGISVGVASGVAALSSMSYFLVKKFKK
ncbi:Hypothetical protein, predicted transmembrane protein [Mycoplasmopsis agalactiae 14628]|uniref:Tail specific protease domain-containing protein n=1 Tax=Mycoplasmopsis agalactiae 14628 TaxID=1110504 RepID=I5D6K3_MYCAA|nr:S41 family peptidase [Mycoplasmopsis agalactiae]EIN15312.1 Hypothetical protein, predicted transmembrane protein [Mycoplasmopsis agalactiae 14628]